MPVFKVKIDRFIALTVQRVSMSVRDDGIDTRHCFINHGEVERCNINGYGNPKIVRIDLRQNGLLSCIANLFVAANEEKQKDKKGKK